MAHYDNTPLWIPAGTNKDDLEWPWMFDSTYCALYRTARLTYVCCGYESKIRLRKAELESDAAMDDDA